MTSETIERPSIADDILCGKDSLIIGSVSSFAGPLANSIVAEVAKSGATINLFGDNNPGMRDAHQQAVQLASLFELPVEQFKVRAFPMAPNEFQDFNEHLKRGDFAYFDASSLMAATEPWHAWFSVAPKLCCKTLVAGHHGPTPASVTKFNFPSDVIWRVLAKENLVVEMKRIKPAAVEPITLKATGKEFTSAIKYEFEELVDDRD